MACVRNCRTRGGRLTGQQRQAPGINRLGVPGGFGQEKLQPLHFGRLGLDQRLGACQRCRRLGALARQQQPGQISIESPAAGPAFVTKGRTAPQRSPEVPAQEDTTDGQT